MIIEKTITDVIDTDYLAFAMYTLEARAIPSVIDGQKPVTRKLLYSMINEHSGKKIKIAELGGGLSKYNFHHGETSAMAAAINMGADWSNNVPIFQQHGNFGTRLVQEAAAPRYIYASLSDAYKKYFIDEEVAPKSFDTENPEPAYYLPVIPWILINGIGGMAVGFKTEILPRSIESVVSATKSYLKNPTKFLADDKPIPPTFPAFRGTVVQVSPNQWKTVGLIDFIGKNTYQISELPIGYDREKYVTLLDELEEKDLIKSYSDECSKSGFGFKVKVSGGQKEQIEKDPTKYFKLEKIHTEILTTLGTDGKLKIFNSVAELIAYFCTYRLTMFGKKNDYSIAKLKSEIQILEHKIIFVNHVIDGKIDFKKTSKAGLLSYIEANITTMEHGKRFTGIPLYDCTNDAVQTILARIQVCYEQVAELEKLTPEQIFEKKLKEITK